MIDPSQIDAPGLMREAESQFIWGSTVFPDRAIGVRYLPMA